MSFYFGEKEKKEPSEIKNDNFDKVSFPKKIGMYINQIKDIIIIYKAERWGVIGILAVIYLIRMIHTKGYYALTYCIGINFLNAFLGFISPLNDPEEEELNSGDSFLPQKNNEEFRPFQRKVKEYAFWSTMFWTFLFAIPMTFFKVFNLPVFWPTLLFYFILIFFLTMRKQIKHMIKYKYLPWDSGKKIYIQK